MLNKKISSDKFVLDKIQKNVNYIEKFDGTEAKFNHDHDVSEKNKKSIHGMYFKTSILKQLKEEQDMSDQIMDILANDKGE